MPFEIVYTSSDAGLKLGDKGFCTVAATKGIAPDTLKLMESLSGYRHTHIPKGDADPRNPTVFSHLRLSTGESLLSRIADAGSDYSKRTNKLAHHLALLPSDQPASGPSRVLSTQGMMIETWEGESRSLPPRRIATSPELSGPCNTWAHTTGDAGWAGELANTAASGDSRQAYIVFSEGMNCLALIDEALSLLSPKDRWQVTFSTFLTSLPVNMKCKWRCILKGSKEHQSIPLHGNLFKIDLTEPLGRAPDSPLAEAARTGIRPIFESIAKPLHETASPSMEASGKAANRRMPAAKSATSIVDAPDEMQGFDLAPVASPFGNAPPPTGFPGSQKKFASKKKSSLPLVLTAIVAGLIGLILGGAGVFAISQNTIAQLTADSKAERTASVDNVQADLDKATEYVKTLEADKVKLDAEKKKLTEDHSGRVAELNKMNAKIADLEKDKKELEKNVLTIQELKKEIAELKNTKKQNPSKQVADLGQPAASKTSNLNNEITLKLQETKKAFIKINTSIETVFLIENGKPDKHEKLTFKDKTWIIESKLAPPTKFFKLSNESPPFELRADLNWVTPHDEKIVHIKSEKQDSFYRFGLSDTMVLSNSNPPINLLIPDLKPSKFELMNLSQEGVDWKPEQPQNPEQLQRLWFVDARGTEVPPPNTLPNPPPPKSFNIKKATLKIEWKKEESKIKASLTIADGGQKLEPEAKNLESVDQLTTAMKDNPLNFDLIMKEVELKWDNNRKVDVKVPLKIKFK